MMYPYSKMILLLTSYTIENTDVMCTLLWKGFVMYPVKWQKNWQLPMGGLLFLEVGFKSSIRAVTNSQPYSVLYVEMRSKWDLWVCSGFWMLYGYFMIRICVLCIQTKIVYFFQFPFIFSKQPSNMYVGWHCGMVMVYVNVPIQILWLHSMSNNVKF